MRSVSIDSSLGSRLLVCEATGPTADEWAEACGTINYEIVTRLGPRVPRVPTGAPAHRPSRTAPRKDPA